MCHAFRRSCAMQALMCSQGTHGQASVSNTWCLYTHTTKQGQSSRGKTVMKTSQRRGGEGQSGSDQHLQHCMNSYVKGISLRAHLHHQLQQHQHSHSALDWLVLTDLHADGAAAGACQNALAFALAPPAETAVDSLTLLLLPWLACHKDCIEGT